MRLVYHQDVQSDVNQALDRYESISPKLAEALWRELPGYFYSHQREPTGRSFGKSTHSPFKFEAFSVRDSLPRL